MGSHNMADSLVLHIAGLLQEIIERCIGKGPDVEQHDILPVTGAEHCRLPAAEHLNSALPMGS